MDALTLLRKIVLTTHTSLPTSLEWDSDSEEEEECRFAEECGLEEEQKRVKGEKTLEKEKKEAPIAVRGEQKQEHPQKTTNRPIRHTRGPKRRVYTSSDDLYYRGSRIQDTQWEVMYEQLVEFYHQHGHTAVSRTCGDRVALGQWCHWQKQYLGKHMKQGTGSALHKHRIHCLDSIRFNWFKKKSSSSSLFSSSFESLQHCGTTATTSDMASTDNTNATPEESIDREMQEGGFHHSEKENIPTKPPNKGTKKNCDAI